MYDLAVTFLDLVVVTTASYAILCAWFYGSIFSYWRAYLEEQPDPRPWWNELLRCQLCLSYHLPWVLGVLLWLPGLWCEWLRLPLYSLAATGLLTFARWSICEPAGRRSNL